MYMYNRVTLLYIWNTTLPFLKFDLFLAVLALHSCVQAFSACGEWGLPFVVVSGLPMALASAWKLQWLRLMGSRARAQQLWHTGLDASGVWDLPSPGTEPVSSALAGRLLTSGPPGRSTNTALFMNCTPYKVKYKRTTNPPLVIAWIWSQ